MNQCQVPVPLLVLGVCTFTMWGHAGTQPQWEILFSMLQREILFSMLLLSPSGAGTNTLLPTGRLESSAMPLLPSQHPLHAPIPGVPQVRAGCWGLGQCESTGEQAEQRSW